MTDNGTQPVPAAENNGSEDISFAELFEQEDHNTVINVGEVATGTVVGIDNDNALIDVGDKAESYISLAEFRHEDPDRVIKIGDEFEVFIERRKDEGGLQLSREKAIAIKVWDKIAQIQEDDETIEGRIESRVKGGMSVDVGVPAFLPYSQIDLRPVKDLDALIGQSFDFKVLKFNRKRNNVVISRRAILEEKRAKLREQMRTSLEEGQTIVHITDLSWGRVSHPSKLYNVGDEIEVKILKYDKDSDRVSLGVKQLRDDPWAQVPETFPVGATVTGTVVSITDYGVFVELEEGVEGLVHISEMSWSKKPRHPSKMVAVEDEIEIKVLKVEAETKRISLGMKQLQPNPWDVVEESYPVGSVIEGKIKNITDFGVFIGIEEGIDGLIHVSDLSWTERIKHPSEKYAKSETIQAVVLKIDKENERFSLGVKQLEPDPWIAAASNYPTGTILEGKITNVTDFGIFVQLEEGIEGLVHISEISKEKIPTPVGMFNVGDTLKAMVISVSADDRKIALSTKVFEEGDEESIKEEYEQKQQAQGPSTIGDLLKAAAEDQDEEDSDK
jgi:small subunit ribosomal protein S1